MSHVLPRFSRPIKSKDNPHMDVSYWSKAMDAYDAKNYRQALLETINYINSNVLRDQSLDDDIQIVHGQGSAEIHISVSQDTFSVKAPFVKITENTNKVPLFRKVAEINFNPLTLAQIRRKQDVLWFEYETPITLCQPYKVYDVLNEICTNTDHYDDEFIEKYQAEFFATPKTTPLSDDEKDTVWQQIQEVFEDYEKFSKEFKEKRWNDYQWDITVLSLLKIVNMSCVHGTLRTKLEEYVFNLFNGQIDFNFRIDKGTNFMQKLLAKSKEEFMQDMYHAESLISLKWRSSNEILQNHAKSMETHVERYINENNQLMLCYYLQSAFLKMIYDYNMEEHHQNAIYDVLERVSSKSLDEARPLLLQTYYAFLDGTAGETVIASATSSTKKGKGFFSKFFS